MYDFTLDDSTWKNTYQSYSQIDKNNQYVFLNNSLNARNYSNEVDILVKNIYDNTVINKIKNGDKREEYANVGTNGMSGTTIVTYEIKDSIKENNRCTFSTEVVDESPLDKRNTKFRIISLSYPFPAKDGTTRLPGENWLNEDNNVYWYITNNRNIQTDKTKVRAPELIYIEKEPLYTITLNASNMIKIRSYNQTNSYDNMQLNCKGTTGRECTSSFLRNKTYVPSLGGTCRNAVANNSGVNSTYYSCADKTAESGG